MDAHVAGLMRNIRSQFYAIAEAKMQELTRIMGAVCRQ